MSNYHHRPEIDGKPAVPVVDTLRSEVRRCEQRLEAARRDLRNWLLSHPED